MAAFEKEIREKIFLLAAVLMKKSGQRAQCRKDSSAHEEQHGHAESGSAESTALSDRDDPFRSSSTDWY